MMPGASRMDRLRAGLLGDLSEEHLSSLHRKVAQTIESLYPDDTTKAPILTHHWAMAGELAKEARCAALAGEQSLNSGAAPEAIRFLERAIALSEELKTVTASERVRLNSQLAQAYFSSGNLPESRVKLRQALLLLGEPTPKGRFGYAAGILMQTLRQLLLHRRFPKLFVNSASAQQSDRLIESARIYGQFTEIYFF